MSTQFENFVVGEGWTFAYGKVRRPPDRFHLKKREGMKPFPYDESIKGDLYMKATGIVRRIEECVIIGQTA